VPKAACEYVGGAMVWTAGCEKANCECMNAEGEGEGCPIPPRFDEEDKQHADSLESKSKRLVDLDPTIRAAKRPISKSAESTMLVAEDPLGSLGYSEL